MAKRTQGLSLAARAAGPDRLLGWLTALAGLLLFAGWLLPVMTVQRFLFLSEEVSVLKGAAELWRGGHHGLCVLLVVFTVLLPSAKIAAALYIWSVARIGAQRATATLAWIDRLGKWSMLDVFVVALVVAAIEVSLIADVEVHAGIYVLAAGILLSMATVRRLVTLATGLSEAA